MEQQAGQMCSPRCSGELQLLLGTGSSCLPLLFTCPPGLLCDMCMPHHACCSRLVVLGLAVNTVVLHIDMIDWTQTSSVT